MHRPVGAGAFAELAGPVEGIDDPQAAVPGDVLEPFLRAHVVVRIEPVELLHQEVVGHAIAGRADVTQGGRVGPELHEGPPGPLRQHGRVAVLGSQVVEHGPLV